MTPDEARKIAQDLFDTYTVWEDESATRHLVVSPSDFIDALTTALLAASKPDERLKAALAANHRFEDAPCPICGYNGPGYFQPDTHPCAKMYHAGQDARLHVVTQAEIDKATLEAARGANQ